MADRWGFHRVWPPSAAEQCCFDFNFLLECRVALAALFTLIWILLVKNKQLSSNASAASFLTRLRFVFVPPTTCDDDESKHTHISVVFVFGANRTKPDPARTSKTHHANIGCNKRERYLHGVLKSATDKQMQQPEQVSRQKGTKLGSEFGKNRVPLFWKFESLQIAPTVPFSDISCK